MRRGVSLVLSAPSGAGKSTLGKMLLAEFPNLGYSISCTTRAIRPGERDGADYFFLDRDDFIKKRDSGYFAEWAEVHGNFYGTPLKPAQEMIEKGMDALFDVDVRGAAQIKARIPETALVFIFPPSMAELERRLRSRGADSAESLRLRMANAASEMRESLWYDSVIINDRLEDAYASLRSAYLAATLAANRNLDFINGILEEALGLDG